MLTALMAFSAQAQTPTASEKIGLVAWNAFQDPTNGLKRYTTALAALDKEFEVFNNELKTMGTRFQTLQGEIQKLQQQVADPNNKVPIPPATIQAKVDEYGQLERDIKKKQEDGKARFESRYKIVVEPIEDDIIKAMSEYATQKGYLMIMDGSKLVQAGVLLAWIEKADVTKDFITFYNARPVPTATR